MAEHIDITYVDNFMEQVTRIGFTGGTAGTDAVLVQAIVAASATVDLLANGLGYTVPDPITGVTNEATRNYLMLATFGAMLGIVYGRKGLKVPDTYQIAIDAHQRLVEGTTVDGEALNLPGLPLNTSAAVGGVASPTTTVSSANPNAKENVFDEMRSGY